MLPDVMAVCRNPGHDIEHVFEPIPVSPVDSPEEDDCTRASWDIDAAGRERPQQTRAKGRIAHSTPGSFTPRSRPTD
jgi:hypothetical protein